ncbi:aminomethyltransferase family protein [Bacillus sp. REN10]|uniref:aminomethyltransferase family protein n=1 Tax=Bacillus sp. REN10 TaxID=2782541 RepID=UPI00193BB314|nr:aminomethyltransferase family protein [Bacillus sp. REN10]
MNKTLKLPSFTKSIFDNYQLVDKGGYGVVHNYRDVEEEYAAIRNKAGIYDATANGLFKITGDSFLEFTNELITIDIEFLDIEKSVFTLMLEDSGDIVDLVTLYLDEDHILLETSPERREIIFQMLNEHNSKQQVEIEDLSEEFAILQVEGPLAWKVCEKLIDFEISALPFQSFCKTEIEGQSTMLARTGLTGEYGYKIFIRSDQANGLVNFLLDQQESDGDVILVGHKALSITMLEIRQPNIEFDLNGLSVFEAAVEWLITSNKEYFIGKENLMNKQRKNHSKVVVGFSVEENIGIQRGDVVLMDKIVGEIIQIEYSYSLGKYIGLILIAKEIGVSNLTMDVVIERLNCPIQLKTISSPYVVPLSWTNKIT